MRGFRDFILRGNVVDLAIAVVIGAAFGAIVDALVKDLITPLIAAIGGQPDFSQIYFTINNSKFLLCGIAGQPPDGPFQTGSIPGARDYQGMSLLHQ
jgi:large conductance mechanosensitive channel protein